MSELIEQVARKYEWPTWPEGNLGNNDWHNRDLRAALRELSAKLEGDQDNLNALARQYRIRVHGADCQCKDCRWFLRGLVSEHFIQAEKDEK